MYTIDTQHIYNIRTITYNRVSNATIIEQIRLIFRTNTKNVLWSAGGEKLPGKNLKRTSSEKTERRGSSCVLMLKQRKTGSMCRAHARVCM